MTKPELRAAVLRHGKSLLEDFHSVVHTALAYDPSSRAMIRPAEALHKTVDAALNELAVALELESSGGLLFCNGVELELELDAAEKARYLIGVLDRIKRNRVTFTAPPPTESIQAFMQAVVAAIRDGDFGSLLASFTGISTDLLPRPFETDPEDGVARRHLRIYVQCLMVLGRFTASLDEGSAPRPSRLKRVARKLAMIEPRWHGLMLAALRIESQWSGATRRGVGTRRLCLREGGSVSPLSNRSLLCRRMIDAAVMVTVVMARLGLDRGRVTDGALAALLYQLGAQYEKAGDPQGRTRQLVRLVALGRETIQPLVAVHDALSDGADERALDADLIRIASEVERRLAKMPWHEVMGEVEANVGGVFDPFAAELFCGTLGRFRVGTTVELDDKSAGVVVDLPHSVNDAHRPRVKLVRSCDGKRLQDGPIVDLCETHRRGQYVRTIDKVIELQPPVDPDFLFFG